MMSRTISGSMRERSSSPLRSLQQMVLSLLCWSHLDALAESAQEMVSGTLCSLVASNRNAHQEEPDHCHRVQPAATKRALLPQQASFAAGG